MQFGTLFFATAVSLFLAGLIYSAARIRVMSELDEAEESGSASPRIWDLSAGVAETSSDAVDGQQ